MAFLPDTITRPLWGAETPIIWLLNFFFQIKLPSDIESANTEKLVAVFSQPEPTMAISFTTKGEQMELPESAIKLHFGIQPIWAVDLVLPKNNMKGNMGVIYFMAFAILLIGNINLREFNINKHGIIRRIRVERVDS